MNTKRDKRGNNQFQPVWLSTYKWIKQKSLTHVTCTLCLKDVAYDNMGEAALKSHAKPNQPGKLPTKHQKLSAEREKASNSLSVLHFVDVGAKAAKKSTRPIINCQSHQSSQSSSVSTSSSEYPPESCDLPQNSSSLASSQNSVQATIGMYSTPLSVAHAEIRWSMKVIMSHFSLRSCLDINNLFQSMFPDSQIAQQFSLSKTKCGYYINYGLAPYYRELLIDKIKQSPFFTVLFDESLNKVLQQEQMDAHIRYWCVNTNRVKSRYLDSQFFNRPNADNITKGIYDALKCIPKEGMIHLSMDGPSTNWLVLDKVQERRKESDLPVLENIGSCGLHVVSGALHTGVKNSSWPLKKVMMSMFKLFDDSPARRDVYQNINGTSSFPTRFCPTRWTENESVAERAIDVLDNVKAVIEHFAREVPSKRPKDNSSYNSLVENQNDPLMKVKMCIFKEIAHKMNTFLVMFQTEAPMLPFLSDTLEVLLRRIMGYFVTGPVLQKAATALALIKLDVTVTSGKCLPTSEIKFPTESKSLLRKVKMTTGQKESFRKQYCDFLIGIVSKFQERSPLRYPLARYASSLNPSKMVNEGEASKIKFAALVDMLFEHKRFTNTEADDAKTQYEDFLATVVAMNKEVFCDFDFTTTGLDEFLTFHLYGKKKYNQLWKVSIFVCVLSHGQADIERGFNINKEVLVENLAKESMVAQRLVYDQLRATGDKIYTIKISRKLVISCKAAHNRYQVSLADKNDYESSEIASNKRKRKMEEVLSVKRKKVEIEKVITSLKGDIEKSSMEASKMEDFESMKLSLEKANLFRDALKKKKETAKELDVVIGKLEEELNI